MSTTGQNPDLEPLIDSQNLDNQHVRYKRERAQLASILKKTVRELKKTQGELQAAKQQLHAAKQTENQWRQAKQEFERHQRESSLSTPNADTDSGHPIVDKVTYFPCVEPSDSDMNYAALASALQKALRDLKGARQQIKDGKEQIDELQSLQQASRQQIASLTERVQFLQIQDTSFKKQNADKQAYLQLIEEQRDLLASKEREMESLRADFQAKEQESASIQEKLLLLERKYQDDALARQKETAPLQAHIKEMEKRQAEREKFFEERILLLQSSLQIADSKLAEEVQNSAALRREFEARMGEKEREDGQILRGLRAEMADLKQRLSKTAEKASEAAAHAEERVEHLRNKLAEEMEIAARWEEEKLGLQNCLMQEKERHRQAMDLVTDTQKEALQLRSKLQVAEAEDKAQKQQIETLQQRLSQLCLQAEEKSAASAHHVQELQNRIEELQQQSRDFEKEWQKRSSQQEKKLAHYQDELENAIALHQKDTVYLQEKLILSEKEIVALKAGKEADLLHFSAKQKADENLRFVLEKMLKDADDEKQRMLGMLFMNDALLDKLTQEKEVLEEETRTLSQQKLEVERLWESQLQSSEALAEKLSTSSAEWARARNEFETLWSQSQSRHRSQLEAHESQVQRLRGELQETVETLQSQIERLQEENKQLASSCAQNLQQWEECRQTMEQQRASLQQKYDAMSESFDKQREQCTECQNQMEAQKELIGQLGRGKEQQDILMENLEKELQQKQAQLQATWQQLQATEQEVQTKERGLQQLEDHLAQKEEELLQAREELQHLCDVKDEMQKQIALEREKAKVMEEERNLGILQEQKMQEQLVWLEQQVRQWHDRCQEAQNKASEFASRMAALEKAQEEYVSFYSNFKNFVAHSMKDAVGKKTPPTSAAPDAPLLPLASPQAKPVPYTGGLFSQENSPAPKPKENLFE